MSYSFCLVLKSFFTSLFKRLQKMRIVSTRFSSGTDECDTSVEVFNAAIGNLISQQRLGDRVYFNTKVAKSKGRCEVSWCDDKLLSLTWEPTELQVSISLPLKDSLENIFDKRGIKIPKCWKLDLLKKGKRVRFRVRKEYAKTIGPFLDLVFRQLYGCSDNYNVHAYIPADYTHFA